MAHSPKIIGSFTHGERVRAIAIAPDGKQIASICEDNLVRLFTTTGTAVAQAAVDFTPFAVSYAATGTAIAVSGTGPGFPRPSSVVVFDAGLAQRFRVNSTTFLTCRFSPDGLLQAITDEVSVRVVEVGSGLERSRFDAPAGHKVRHAAFSPDSAVVAVGTGAGLDQGELVTFAASTGGVLTRLARSGQVRFVCFSADGALLGYGAVHEIGVVERVTGAVRVVPNPVLPHTGNLRDPWLLTFSPDGSLLAAVTSTLNGINPDIRLHEVGSLVVRHELLDGFSGLFAFSPDSLWAMSAETGTDVRVWSTATGSTVCELARDADVSDLHFGRHGVLAAVAVDRVVTAFDLSEPERARVDHAGAVRSVAFSGDGTLVASGGADNVAKVFDPVAAPRTSVQHDGAVVSVLWVPGRRWVVTASADATARVVDVVSSAEQARTSHGGPVNAVAASADGRLVASGGADGVATTVALDSGARRSFQFADIVHAVALDTNGSRLAVGCDDRSAVIVNTATGLQTPFSHGGVVRAVSLSPDGTWLASACDDGLVRLFRIATGVREHELRHDGPVRAVAFNPSGSRLVTASDDGSSRIFGVSDGTEQRRLAHDGPVRAATFDSRGSLVATGSSDRAARLFRVGDGLLLRTYAQGGPVNAVSFAPAGGLLATASDDKTVRIYPLPL